jgi:hypothetical protein
MNTSHASQKELAALLQKRLAIVADRDFRERDSAGHLDALREVSEAINAKYQALKPQLPPRLRHFMEQASYSKALEYIEQEGASA